MQCVRCMVFLNCIKPINRSTCFPWFSSKIYKYQIDKIFGTNNSSLLIAVSFNAKNIMFPCQLKTIIKFHKMWYLFALYWWRNATDCHITSQNDTHCVMSSNEVGKNEYSYHVWLLLTVRSHQFHGNPIINWQF